MSRDLELNFKFKGSSTELDKLGTALRVIQEQAKKSGTDLSGAEKAIAGLEGAIKKAKTASDETSHSFEGFHESIRTNLENPIQSFRIRLTESLDKMGTAPAILVGIGVGASVLATKMYELVEAQSAAARTTTNFATKLGLSVGQTLKLQAEAKIAGVDIGGLDAATRMLSQALEAGGGQGAMASKALKQLGVSAHDSSGNIREMGPVLMDVLSALGQIQNTTERTSIARNLLGRGAVELMPMIANLKELNATVEKLGVANDAGLVKSLAAADDEIKKMEITWDRIFKKLAAGIAVPITTFIRSMMGEEYEGGRTPYGPGAGGTGASHRIVGGRTVQPTFGQMDASLRGMANAAALGGQFSTNLDLKGAGNFGTGIVGGIQGFFGDQDALKRQSAQQLLAAFHQRQTNDPEVLKTELEQSKKAPGSAATPVSSWGSEAILASLNDAKKMGDPAKVKEMTDAYDKAIAHQKDLTAKIKQLEELPAALKELASETTKAAADQGTATQKAIAAINAHYDEMDSKLGPASKSQRAQNQANRNSAIADEMKKSDEELQKKVAELEHRTAEAYTKSEEERARIFANVSKQTEEKIRQSIEHSKIWIEGIDAREKIGSSANARQTADEANALIRSNDRQAGPQNEAQIAQADYSIRLSLAKQLYDESLKDSNSKLATAREIIIKAKENQDITEQIRDIDKAITDQAAEKAKFDEQTAAARLEYEEKIFDIVKKQGEAARDAAGQVFDALRLKGTGMAKMMKEFGVGQARIVFQNLAAPALKNLSQSLGAAGGSTGLGGLLAGTVMDPKNAGPGGTLAAPLIATTSSLDLLRTSVDDLNDTVTAAAGVGTGDPGAASTTGGMFGNRGTNPTSALPSGLDAFLGTGPASGNSSTSGSILAPVTAAVAGLGALAAGLAKLTGGSSGGAAPSASSGIIASINQFGKGVTSVIPKDAGGGYMQGAGTVRGTGLFGGLINPGPDESKGQVFGNTVASVGAVAAGAEGVIAGINQGGARGATSSIGSALGVAALIPGPQQPFVAAAAMLTGVIKSLLPDPKAMRQYQIGNEIFSAQQAASNIPQGITVSIDSSGQQISRNAQGQIRVLNQNPLEQAYNNVTNIVDRPENPANPFDTAGQGELVSNLADRLSLTGQTATPLPKATTVVNLNINALDSQSIMSRSNDIANAMVAAVQHGHRFGTDIVKIANPR